MKEGVSKDNRLEDKRIQDNATPMWALDKRVATDYWVSSYTLAAILTSHIKMVWYQTDHRDHVRLLKIEISWESNHINTHKDITDNVK